MGKRCITMIFLLFLIFYTESILAVKVALTIDDLPYVGQAKDDPEKLRREENRFLTILAILKKYHVPATGFVVVDSIEPGQWELLQQFRQAGNLIGNHTYSHMNLNQHSTEQFIEDIEKADKILNPLMSMPKYFRYPFLATGRNCQAYLSVRAYLHNQGYVIAPATIDGKDFNLNYQLHEVPWQRRKQALDRFKQRYINATLASAHKAEQKAMQRVHHPVAQILLIHMNTLNAYFLGDLIEAMQKQGYEFVSLPTALQDDYYQELDLTELAYQKKKCQRALEGHEKKGVNHV